MNDRHSASVSNLDSGPSRRALLQAAGVGAAAAAVSPVVFGQAAPPAERVVVAVMGTSGRGTAVGSAFASSPGCVVKYVIDVDEIKGASAAAAIGKRAAAHGGPAPQVLKDFRKALEDKEVQALAIAAPNHWHAPAAILACTAGKHVYVEKPCSHNPREGELLVEAARKYNRCVQHGTQRRSWPKIREAIEKVHSGTIGPVKYARTWYTNSRKPFPKGKVAPVPATFDWDLWQGPAPRTEFHDNYHPYNWHWFWAWGSGECGNNGVHGIDVARWGLGVDCPRRVTSGGGRYYYTDDQETPDVQVCTYDYGDKFLMWDGKSCHPRGLEAQSTGFGIAFYGDNGSLVTDSAGYSIYDLKNKEIAKVVPEKGSSGDEVHVINFLDAVRANDPKKLNAEIAEGVSSALLCHLANIAYRSGRTVNVDPATKRIVGDDDQVKKYWSREYQAGWEPKV